MRLTELAYSPAQQQFLTHLRGLGAVLDTIILAADQPVTDIYAASQAATRAGMAILTRRHEQEHGYLEPLPGSPGRPTLRIFPAPEPRGYRISFPEFIGAGYDLATGQLQLFEYSPDQQAIAHRHPEGLAHALLNPPYGLYFVRTGPFASPAFAAGESQFYGKLLRDYLALLLGVTEPGDAAALTIFAWSADWSNYFAEGQEWWGAFCWTIYDVRTATIAFLAASATD